ncbi:hypothetical protein HPB51_007540 [Rhipicephalus microplus]|uniref:Uncharacterized protein n=1 Tax=Rhipicephalus microplus TaxID=6941 RepID=A0A9J6ES59_RHIMP|nr:hypothetical protein HPB51_007540 [Rhipicephalus microplus]
MASQFATRPPGLPTEARLFDRPIYIPYVHHHAFTIERVASLCNELFQPHELTASLNRSKRQAAERTQNGRNYVPDGPQPGRQDVVEGIEDSLQFWSEQYDDLLRRVEQNEHHIKELRRRTEKLETQNSNVSEMEAEINNPEWRSRRLNLEFHGIMPTENEDLLNKVNALAPDVELPPLQDDAVAAIHRLPSKKGKIPGIICRFTRQADRDKW